MQRSSVALLPALVCALVLLGGTGQAAAQTAGGPRDVAPPPPVAPDTATRDDNGRATVRGVRIDQPLRLDGRLDDEVYKTVPPIGGFIQQLTVEITAHGAAAHLEPKVVPPAGLDAAAGRPANDGVAGLDGGLRIAPPCNIPLHATAVHEPAEDEKALIEKCAKKAGMTVSEYIRACMLMEMVVDGEMQALKIIGRTIGMKAMDALSRRLKGSQALE